MTEYRKALKNYSTVVPASRTFGEIQQILIDFGARGIGTDLNEQGVITNIHFKIMIKEREQFIKVPLRLDKVIELLRRQNKFKDEAHAYRVAMRNVKDLLDAQTAFLATEMVTFEELMLPFFITKTGDTLYEALEKKQFALTE